MNSARRQDRIGRVMLCILVSSLLFVLSTGVYTDNPSATPYIIAALSLITGLLAVVNVEQIKHRNVHADRARAAEYNSMLQRKRADRLNDENKRYFNAHMSHVPAEVMVRTLASMGEGPIRIRNIGPETEWYKIATSPKYRHLFHADDVRTLEAAGRSEARQ